MPRPRHRLLRRLLAAGVLVAVFWFTYRLYSAHNDAPYWYHPDEESKAQQILNLPYWIDGVPGRNYKHPQLLLEATELWVYFAKTPADRQQIVEAGRHVSAVFGALAVVTFAGAAGIGFGLRGLIVAAAALALCPPLLVYSHHMKEDAALALGIGTAVLATAFFWRTSRRTIGWFVALPLLGIATAIAPSGKYVGVMVLLISLPALLAPWRRWWHLPIRFGVFALFFVGAVAAINWRVFENWDRFNESLNWEIDHATTGHGDLTMNAPNSFIMLATRLQTAIHAQTLAAAAVVLVISRLFTGRRRAWRREGWILLVVWLTIGCATALSFGKIPFYRYALPVVILMHFLAAVAVLILATWVAEKAGPTRRTWIVNGISIAAVAMFVAIQLPTCLAHNRGYADDSRQHLREWLSKNAGVATPIVADYYTLLRYQPDPRSRVGQTWPRFRVAGPREFAMRRGDVMENLRNAGIKYVIVTDANYDRYTLPFTRAEPGSERSFERTRNFYSTVFRQCKLAWTAGTSPRTFSFSNPEIRVYEVPVRLDE